MFELTHLDELFFLSFERLDMSVEFETWAEWFALAYFMELKFVEFFE